MVWTEEKEALLLSEPDKFFTTPHYDGYPMVLVRIEAVDREELTELLDGLLAHAGRYGALVMAEPEFDVVVFGATSVTGRRVCAYLAERGANWAGAARDAARPRGVLAECGVERARDHRRRRGRRGVAEGHGLARRAWCSTSSGPTRTTAGR